jgi:hypothetical protein
MRMITNLAWFASLPAILLVSRNSVSAEEQIVPALSEPVQPIPVDSSLDPDKIVSGALSKETGNNGTPHSPVQIDKEKR